MSNDKNSRWDRMKLTLAGLGQPIGEEQFEAQIDRAIRITGEKIKRSKEDATAAKAKRIHAHRRFLDVKSEQKKLEGQAVAFLQSRSKPQAQTLAFEISRLSQARVQWEEAEEAAKGDERTQALLSEVLEGQLRRLKHQLGVLRAAANLQRTQEALATNPSQPPDPTPQTPSTRIKKPRSESPEQVMARLTDLASRPPKPKSKRAASPTASAARKQK